MTHVATARWGIIPLIVVFEIACLQHGFCTCLRDFPIDSAKHRGYERRMIRKSTRFWHCSQLGYRTEPQSCARGGAMFK